MAPGEIVLAGHHQHRQLRLLCSDAATGLQTPQPRQAEIEQNHIHHPVAQQRQGLLTVVDGSDRLDAGEAAERDLQAQPEQFVVFDHQHVHPPQTPPSGVTSATAGRSTSISAPPLGRLRIPMRPPWACTIWRQR
jgi:hypothetical protein